MTDTDQAAAEFQAAIDSAEPPKHPMLQAIDALEHASERLLAAAKLIPTNQVPHEMFTAHQDIRTARRLLVQQLTAQEIG